ncbi:MAG: peptidyl-prolyl cis-trans isomerase, partial [Proteobacteria bacterium]|nr:peptidyl-prolyl cis-trans isomerase [Pseudomonadota bacterium]
VDIRAKENLIRLATLKEEIRNINLSVGDKETGKEISGIEQFHGPGGRFDIETYKRTLEQIGKTVTEFETDIRDDISQNLLKETITGGLKSSGSFAEILYRYYMESRTISFLTLDESDLEKPLALPDDVELQKFYSSDPNPFKTKEVKELTYISLTPEMLLNSIEIESEEILSAYNSRISEFVVPELRSVERLAFKDTDTAKKAAASLRLNELSFDDIISTRGLTSQDVGLGFMSKKDFSLNEADVIFGLEANVPSEVIDTTLGPAIYRVVDISLENTTSLLEATASLTYDIKTQKAKLKILNLMGRLEDLLASGATLEEVSEQTDATLLTVDFGDISAQGISKDPEFRSVVQGLSSEDYPSLTETADGSVFAVRLDSITPPRVPSLSEVKESVTEAWKLARLKESLTELALIIKRQIDDGKEFGDLNFSNPTETTIRRSSNSQNISPEFSFKAFELDLNETDFILEGENLKLIQLKKINIPTVEDDAAKIIISQINEQTLTELRADVFDYYYNSLKTSFGLKLDQSAITAVHQQLR